MFVFHAILILEHEFIIPGKFVFCTLILLPPPLFNLF